MIDLKKLKNIGEVVISGRISKEENDYLESLNVKKSRLVRVLIEEFIKQNKRKEEKKE